MKVTVYRSDSVEKKLCKSAEYDMPYVNTDVNEVYGHPGDIEANILNIHDDIEYQTVLGIGGAFSESAATAKFEVAKIAPNTIPNVSIVTIIPVLFFPITFFSLLFVIRF